MYPTWYKNIQTWMKLSKVVEISWPSLTTRIARKAFKARIIRKRTCGSILVHVFFCILTYKLSTCLGPENINLRLSHCFQRSHTLGRALVFCTSLKALGCKRERGSIEQGSFSMMLDYPLVNIPLYGIMFQGCFSSSTNILVLNRVLCISISFRFYVTFP